MDERITDEEAVERIRGGDMASYGILATRHHSSLRNVARRFLDSEADVEDAVQGAHLLALTHFHQYAGRSSYLRWMCAITRNEAFTQRRRRKGTFETLDEQLDSLPSSQRDPERQVMDRDLDTVLGIAMASLPSSYRAVFRLREMESVDTAEAGRRLGLTGACVKSRLHRARVLLRRSLARKLKLENLPEYLSDRDPVENCASPRQTN